MRQSSFCLSLKEAPEEPEAQESLCGYQIKKEWKEFRGPPAMWPTMKPYGIHSMADQSAFEQRNESEILNQNSDAQWYSEKGEMIFEC